MLFRLEYVKQHIALIKQTIVELESKGKNDPFDFEMEVLCRYPEFYQDHPFLVKRLCKKESTEILEKMMGNLQDIEDGNKSLSAVELKLGEELAEKFLYPHVKK